MQLNLKTSESGTTEHIAFRLYTEATAQVDELADKLNVKRSVVLRHIINEYFDKLHNI